MKRSRKRLMESWAAVSIGFLVLLLVASLAAAQTPNGLPPANEGVCDELMWATPGLYGLCVAFCEAQDCEADFSLTDPFENCGPSAQKLLSIYDKKKQAGDPDMPCIQPACPCWSQAELDGLRYPSPTDGSSCTKDHDIAGTWTNRDFWGIFNNLADVTGVASYEDVLGLGPRCTFADRCEDGSCLQISRSFFITAAEFAICEAQVDQAGADRGFSCFP